MRKPLITAVLVLLLSGCATLFGSDTKIISFGSRPEAAEVLIDGASYGTTPVSLELNNHESHVVVFRKEGYRDITCNLDASVETTWVILDVLGGLIPLVVDVATGNWKGIQQESCDVDMVPSSLGLASENGWVQFVADTGVVTH